MLTALLVARFAEEILRVAGRIGPELEDVFAEDEQARFDVNSCAYAESADEASDRQFVSGLIVLGHPYISPAVMISKYVAVMMVARIDGVIGSDVLVYLISVFTGKPEKR
jgi:hypothetical protein